MEMVGFDQSKVHMPTLIAVASGLGVSNNGFKADHLARLVHKKFIDVVGDEALLTCSNCRGRSPSDRPDCPYCGLEEADKTNGLLQLVKMPISNVISMKQAATSLNCESELDRVVENIRKLDKIAKESFYDAACELRRIHETNLWKLRTQNGVPVHKTWEEFCKKELNMSKQWANERILIATRFTPEEVKGQNASNLVLIARAPLDHKAALLEESRNGIDREKLKAKVRELNLGEGKLPKVTKPIKKEKPLVIERPDEITLATLTGKKQTIALVQPKKDDKGEFLPAKTLEDQPQGWFDLQNGVRLYFRISRFPTQQLKLTFEAKREEI